MVGEIMASWIVHLRIADNLLNLIEGLEPVYFAIGNVATDSGIPDENWENFDPPAELLHFQKSNADLWHLADPRPNFYTSKNRTLTYGIWLT
jgi:hypothetical protein